MEFINADTRQLIPRWFTSSNIEVSCISTAKGSINDLVLMPESHPNLVKSRQKWSQEKNVTNAIDLFSRLKLIDINSENEEIQSLRDFLNKNKSEVSKTVLGFINSENSNSNLLIHELSVESIRQKIRSLKDLLLKNPKNPLIWNDLSFLYAAIGQDEKATQSLRVAFEVSNKHPMIARFYSRLLTHTDNQDHALHILNLIEGYKTNPVLLSADIALRDRFNLGAPDVKRGMKLIEQFEASKPGLISELAASIGTIEISHGAKKKGKKFLSQSVINPTENTLAQVQWLSQKHHVAVKIDSKNTSSEASAMDAYRRGSYAECIDYLVKHHAFEPYGKRSLIDALYLSIAAFGDGKYAVNLFERFSGSLNESFQALNNVAVAYIYNNNFSEAQKYIQKANEALSRSKDSKTDQPTILATTGMFFYRTGDPEFGRKLYDSARNMLQEVKQHKRSLGRLLFFYGQEEHRVDQNRGLEILRESRKILKETGGESEFSESLSKYLGPDKRTVIDRTPS